MGYLKPHRLDGTSISAGIIQTSESGMLFPKRHARAVAELQRLFPGKVNDYTEYAEPLGEDAPREFADRFHRALGENQLIVSLTGGYTTNCMLDYVDFELVRATRRIITGYSDTTALLSAILAKAGLSVLYGPALLGSFGEWPHMNGDAASTLKRLVSGNTKMFSYARAAFSSDSDPFWDREDEHPLEYRENRPWRGNCADVVEGVLFGGNLNTLLALAGSGYFEAIDGGVLMLEDAHTSLFQLKRDIESLRQRGVFEHVGGVLFGKMFQSGTQDDNRAMGDWLLDRFGELGVPAMVDIDFGHGYPQLAFPLGVPARIDYGKSTIILLEGFAG